MRKLLVLLGFTFGSSLVLVYSRMHPFFLNKTELISLIGVVALLAVLSGWIRFRVTKLNDLESRRFDFWRAALFLGIGFSSLLIKSFFDVITHMILHNQVMILVIYLAAIFAPLVYYLSYLTLIILFRHNQRRKPSRYGPVLALSALLGIGMTVVCVGLAYVNILIALEFCFLMLCPFFVTFFTYEQGFYFIIMLGFVFFVLWLNFNPLARLVARSPKLLSLF